MTCSWSFFRCTLGEDVPERKEGKGGGIQICQPRSTKISCSNYTTASKHTVYKYIASLASATAPSLQQDGDGQLSLHWDVVSSCQDYGYKSMMVVCATIPPTSSFAQLARLSYCFLTASMWVQNWAAVCAEVCTSLLALALISVVHNSSLFKGLVSFAYLIASADSSTTLTHRQQISTKVTYVASLVPPTEHPTLLLHTPAHTPTPTPTHTPAHIPPHAHLHTYPDTCRTLNIVTALQSYHKSHVTKHSLLISTHSLLSSWLSYSSLSTEVFFQKLGHF